MFHVKKLFGNSQNSVKGGVITKGYSRILFTTSHVFFAHNDNMKGERADNTVLGDLGNFQFWGEGWLLFFGGVIKATPKSPP